jgi:hypothetical protein
MKARVRLQGACLRRRICNRALFEMLMHGFTGAKLESRKKARHGRVLAALTVTVTALRESSGSRRY